MRAGDPVVAGEERATSASSERRRATIAAGRWNGIGSCERLVLVDAEQHDHEQEQHDDRARVDDDLHRGDELRRPAAGRAPRR